MSNQNNVPTEPGWYYRMTPRGTVEPVQVHRFYLDNHLSYQWSGSTEIFPVEADGLWAGPVPMPGEWAPRELFDDLWRTLSRINPAPGTPVDEVLQAAKAWDAQNPIPEATP